MLDVDQGGRTVPYRRALLATLIFAGLRIGEALARLRSEDVVSDTRRPTT
ncbi:MAG: hypothetical protein ICV69_14000 [Thermoleophilaceae bacterium]|nr:hypothetical protein [Thermoleophilaceae bacterium]